MSLPQVCLVLHDWQAKESGCMSIGEGDFVLVHKKDAEWFEGTAMWGSCKGQRGKVPATYCRVLDDGLGKTIQRRISPYNHLFVVADLSKDGILQEDEVTRMLLASELVPDLLAHIWDLCRVNSYDANVTEAEFDMALGLVAQAQQDLPLDVDLIRRCELPPNPPLFPLLKPKNPFAAKATGKSSPHNSDAPMSVVGVVETKAQKTFAIYDKDKNGVLDENEFVFCWEKVAVLDPHFKEQDQGDEALRTAFRLLTNGAPRLLRKDFVAFYHEAHEHTLSKAIEAMKVLSSRKSLELSRKPDFGALRFPRSTVGGHEEVGTAGFIRRGEEREAVSCGDQFRHGAGGEKFEDFACADWTLNKNSSIGKGKEQTLMEQINQKMPDVAARVLHCIQRQDFVAVVHTLQSSSLNNLPFVANLLHDILGPISEAHGIAKAVVSVALTVLDMVLTVQANNVTCAKLGHQMQDLQPSLDALTRSLGAKAVAVLTTSVNGDEMDQFKLEIASLQGPLTSLQIAVNDCVSLIKEWADKGEKLFGKVRQMLTGKSYCANFETASDSITGAMSRLQMALGVMTFISVNSIQKNWPSTSHIHDELIAALAEDRAKLPQQMNYLMQRDAEFKREMQLHFVELKDFLGVEFADLKRQTEFQTQSIIETVESSSNMLLSAIGYIGTCVTNALFGQNEGGTVYIVANDCRASDSFPGNDNLDATDNTGERVTLCFVGTPGNTEFLHQFSKEFSVGNIVDVRSFVESLRVKLIVHRVSFIFWMASNGAHFYFGSVAQSDVIRLENLGKKNVQGEFFGVAGAADRLGLSSSQGGEVIDAVDFVIAQHIQKSVKIVKVDIRSSDSFPGNRNLDLTDSAGQRVTLCFVGSKNEAFLVRHYSKFVIGSNVDVGNLTPNLKIALQIRKESFIFWMAENGAHFYFGSDVTFYDKERLELLGKKDITGKFF